MYLILSFVFVFSYLFIATFQLGFIAVLNIYILRYVGENIFLYLLIIGASWFLIDLLFTDFGLILYFNMIIVVVRF